MRSNQVNRVWEEHVVNVKKGNRIIHYVLRDNAGTSVLAVVGKQRKPRHFTYTLTEDYLRVFGSTTTLHAGTKWKSRDQVVDLLVSLAKISAPIIAEPDEQQIEAFPDLKYLMVVMTKFSERHCLLDMEVIKNSKFHAQVVAQNSEIVWSGDAYICMKQLKHYPAFVRNETNIHVHSMVWALDEDREYFIGYVKDLYENEEGEKRVQLIRFLSRVDAEGLIPNINAECREVFISSKEEDISAHDIDGLAAVLAPSHLKSSEDYNFPLYLLLKCFMCHRKIESDNGVSPFSISILPGYSSMCEGLDTLPKNATKGAEERQKPCVQVNINIELLSQDSGMHGCWFRCRVMRSIRSRLKVQYYDHVNVQECVPAMREAAPDNMGVRRSGRLRVRPWRHRNSSNIKFEVGAAVDAWWCNGWWEGFVIGPDTCAENKFQIYFPGEKMFMAMERKHLRISKEWVDNKWVDLIAKPDILSVIADSSVLSKLS